MSGIDPVLKLIDLSSSEPERRLALREFAIENGWHPSDEILAYRDTSPFANGHLVVEHGLDNTAVITFLRQSTPFTALSFREQHTLLSLSYNNLVDWHLFPDRYGILRIFNRTTPLKTQYVSLSDEPAAFRAESFDKIIGRKPNPNVPALDDALISTVGRWRRILAGDLDLASDTRPIAELFNAIFFIRALEDEQRKYTGEHNPHLLEVLRKSEAASLEHVISIALTELTKQPVPIELIDFKALSAFDALDREAQYEMFSDFYQNRFAPYAYDFSVMSKHALSRIYERYISTLRPVSESQQYLFTAKDSVTEVAKRALGEVYTPQYIARFFARYIKENTTPARFRALSVLDPACGSGMFLRTLLEAQCDPLTVRDVKSVANEAFANVHGIDIEENACKATRLSLYLLHLALTGAFPNAPIDIQAADAIKRFLENAELAGTFDVAVANPPFVRWEAIPGASRELVQRFLEGSVEGRLDLYIAFLKLALDALRPGGVVLFVLPHAFLLATNAAGLRKRLSSEFWIRHIVDLSELDVFPESSSYPILLIAERKQHLDEPPAIVTRCSGFAGHALEAALRGRPQTTAFYTVYAVPQRTFAQDVWRILSPQDYEISVRLASLVTLESVCEIGQGLNTGCDKVFVRRYKDVPAAERRVYVPLLRDREMQRYIVPSAVDRAVFYPAEVDRILKEDEIEKRYPETWAYLTSHFDVLNSRSSVKHGHVPWWKPERMRRPKTLLRPKIVGPHLMLVPRFALDVDGRYAVSRSPYIFHRDNDVTILKLLLAILNSSIGHWQIATQSHRYDRGYARLEASTLRTFRVPSLASIPPTVVSGIVDCVEQLLKEPEITSQEDQLEELISGIYGMDLSTMGLLTGEWAK